MKLGFTGTRTGMSDEQHRAFIRWAASAGIAEFHWGVCVGADSDAVNVMFSADDLKFPRPRIVAHPPRKNSLVSHADLMFADETRPPDEYHARNRNIVAACDVLAACPKGEEEHHGSGTWMTVRFARKAGKPVVIFWPDGLVQQEEKS